MLTNEVVISIIVLLVLSLLRINVVIALVISALTAGVIGGLGLPAEAADLNNLGMVEKFKAVFSTTIKTFTNGLGGGAEVAMNAPRMA